MFSNNAREFLNRTGWGNTILEPLSGDASARKYFRLRRDNQSVVLMDASQVIDTVAPFILIGEHLRNLGFSAPAILARDEQNGLLLLEDFGDATFAKLLDGHSDPVELYTLATDALIALQQNPQAIPSGLRTYQPEKTLDDIELYLEWCAPGISETGRAEFKKAWLDVLPVAHQVTVTLLLRDYHVANLMLLPNRTGIQKVGLLDFQDAYRGPVTYDLVSLLEDARHDVSDELRTKMIARYLAQFPALDRKSFETSMAILAAVRHTRVLAIFERLSRRDGKHEYRQLHSTRVERLLQSALRHPILAGVKRWFEQYAWKN